ncbi:MAG: lipoprotein signal peptidase [Bacteroidetes bacterium]|nr:lipoprotein signal peptidase [Bacteroidota bacterium]
MKKSLLIVFVILLIDQFAKVYIKTNFILGENHEVTNWFFIHFVENNGMAFGLEFEGQLGKFALSFFRIVFVSAMGYYLFRKVIPTGNNYFIITLSMVFAGALGNIIDSVFYGVLFSASDYQVAQFLPPDGGYASVLHGKVVDMFYFPLVSAVLPSWFPVWGGEHFEFFRPVFNVADSAISVGIAIMIIFQKKVFHEEHPHSDSTIEENSKTTEAIS